MERVDADWSNVLEPLLLAQSLEDGDEGLEGGSRAGFESPDQAHMDPSSIGDLLLRQVLVEPGLTQSLSEDAFQLLDGLT